MVRWIGNEWRQARKQVRAVGDGASEHYLPELQQHWLVTVQRSPAYQQKGRRSSRGHLDHRGKQYWHVISSHNPLTQAQRKGGRDSRASSERKASEQKKNEKQKKRGGREQSKRRQWANSLVRMYHKCRNYDEPGSFFNEISMNSMKQNRTAKDN